MCSFVGSLLICIKGSEQADKVAKALKVYDNKMIKVAYGRGAANSFIRTAIINTWQKALDKENKWRYCYSIQKSVHSTVRVRVM